jgi:glutamate dehydrogenase (NAD(P)+)
MANVLEVTWTDPETGKKGYVVIERLIRGVSSGGLRMREGCTIDEVRGLAQAMTRKEALHYRPDFHYIPFGGAKGGIDCSPNDPDAQEVLTRFLAGVKPIVEQFWATGEDFGVRQESIDQAISDIGLKSSVQAAFRLIPDAEDANSRLYDAAHVDVDGIGLDLLVGGRGVAQAALTALSRTGDGQTAGKRVVVQGFGSMGGATARFLNQEGLKIVGVVDADGAIVNQDGLDVETLLKARDNTGRIDRAQLRSGDSEVGLNDWLGIDCDVLIPAAISYCITPENENQIRAGLVVEAANMPVLPEAEAQLADRGVRVVPDFVANSGTNAWWWWTLFGDVEPTAESAFAMVDQELHRLVDTAYDTAEAQKLSLREAAMEIVDEHLADMDQRFDS